MTTASARHPGAEKAEAYIRTYRLMAGVPLVLPPSMAKHLRDMGVDLSQAHVASLLDAA